MINLDNDKEWAAFLTIIRFLDKKQGSYLEKNYVDLEHGRVDVPGLKKVKGGSSLTFMLELALHLFNHYVYKLKGLNGMDNLDYDYSECAFDAMRIRYGLKDI